MRTNNTIQTSDELLDSRQVSPWREYAWATFAVFVAGAVRALVDAPLGNYAPYAVFYASVIFAAWHGGFRAAIFALVLSFLCATYLFVPPRCSLAITTLDVQVHAGVYFLVSFAIAYLGGEMHRARQQAQALAKQAVERKKQLEHEAINRDKLVDSLTEAHRVLQTLLENVPEGVTLVGGPPDFPILATSKFGQQLMGRDSEQLQGLQAGHHAEAFGILLADGVTRPRPEQLPLYRATRYGETILGEEWVIERADGSQLTALFNVVPIRNDQGEIIGAVNCWRDITERKQIEQSLRDADRRKDEFLAMLGHELRNPLASIVTSVQVLNRIGVPSPEAREMRDLINRRAMHMTRLIDELLDASRISRGQVFLRVEHLDLTELVRRTTEDHRSMIEQRGLILSLELPDRPLGVNADAVRMAQVLGNLLHNSSKFVDPGGMVSVSLAPTEDGCGARITVHDNGVGIEPDSLATIFQGLEAGAVSRPKAHGLGLGLSVVQGLVRLHGGTVTAASAGSGLGSTFTVVLPLAHESTIGPAQPVLSRRKPRICKVLIVDDSPEITRSLSLLLRLSGHHVEVAEDGKSGIELARRFLPDVVLCDIRMPGELDGYMVAQRLRSAPTAQKMYLVALTGFGQDRDRQRACEAGFDRHLTKPVLESSLDELLVELVGESGGDTNTSTSAGKRTAASSATTSASV